ncbi:M15 family metallopeptidase [Kribbella sp. NPDC055071]
MRKTWRSIGVVGVVLLGLVPVGPAQADDDPTSTPPTSTPPASTPATATPPAKAATATPPPAAEATATPQKQTWSIALDQPAAAWEDLPTVFAGKVNRPFAGFPVTLWQRVPGAWVLRATTRTVSGGGYKFSYAAPYTGTSAFRTVIGTAATGALAISAERTVTIQERTIVIDKPAAWYATLTGVSVTGRLLPAQPGKEVGLQQYLGSGKWALLSIAKMDSRGNFRLRVPDDLPGTRTVRVLTRYVSQPAMEYSALATVVVKADLNPKVYAVSASMVPKTYRAGCPVKPSQLRLLQLNYWGFDHKVHRGELVLRDAAVAKMITVWTATFNSKFPIRQMRRVDAFGGNDVTSMAADNTSAFNCRRVTGDPYSLSPHSYGWAIDINTVENPYLAANGVWYPSNGLAFRNRSTAHPGMLFASSVPTKSLVAQGYFWGAGWAKPDYQHFEPK